MAEIDTAFAIGGKLEPKGDMPEKSTVELLREMQTGLELVMIAVKKSDMKEAERVLYIVGPLLDRALAAERGR